MKQPNTKYKQTKSNNTIPPDKGTPPRINESLGREIGHTANLCTKILDCRGLDSSIILILRGGIPRPTGNFPQMLSQAILIGIILVGRLGVHPIRRCKTFHILAIVVLRCRAQSYRMSHNIKHNHLI